MFCTSINEVQIIDTKQVILTLMTASIPDYIEGQKGATLANYVELKSLIKDEKGNIEGAVLLDKIKNETFKVKTKVLVNCAGVFSDTL